MKKWKTRTNRKTDNRSPVKKRKTSDWILDPAKIRKRVSALLEGGDPRVVFINQPMSNGDVLFLAAAMKLFKQAGHEVVWPMKDGLLPLNKHFPEPLICGYDKTSHKDMYGHGMIEEPLPDGRVFVSLPLASSCVLLNVPHVMPSKYDLMGIPLDTWRSAEIIEDPAATEKLMALVPKTEFCLRCRPYGLAGTELADIPAHEHMPTIDITRVPGCTTFDWMPVIKAASALRLVDTCFALMAELVDLKEGVEYGLWNRPQERENFLATERVVIKPTERHVRPDTVRRPRAKHYLNRPDGSMIVMP